MVKALIKSSFYSSHYSRVLHVVEVHFLLVLAYVLGIISFDAWNLITHESVAQRWTYAGVLAIFVTIIWFLLKRYTKSAQAVTSLAYLLIALDIAFAGFNVYAQRGMASKAVMLFAVPLIVAAQLKSKFTVLATGALCVIVYSIAAVRYFHLFYGEGYRVELYGEVGFFSAIILILALMLLPRHHQQ